MRRYEESSSKKGQKMTPHQHGEESDEASRFHQVERRLWRGGVGSGRFDDKPGAGFPRAGASEAGFQGIRRPARGLSDGGGDRKSRQEARGRHRWPALGPDVSVDATRQGGANDGTT